MSLLEKSLSEGDRTGLGCGMQGGEVRPQKVGSKGLACQGRSPGLASEGSRSCGSIVSMDGVHDPLALKGPV